MCTITLDINSRPQELVSLYEKTYDFKQFLIIIRDFFKENPDQIKNHAIIDKNDYATLLSSLNIIIEEKYQNEELTQKRTGRYFTPKGVCHFINLRALENFYKFHQKKLEIPVILDPSSGLGNFIIDMFFTLLKSNLEDHPSTIDVKNITSRLFCYEIDKKINYLSRNLFLSIITLFILNEDSKCSFSEIKKIIRNNFIHDDFLKSDCEFSPNIIIGNPPYVRVHKIDSKYNSYLREHFFSAKFDFDLYVCFFEKGLKILTSGGILGYITPEKFLIRKYAKNLRFILLRNTVLLEIIDVSRCHELFHAFTYPIITIFRKTTDQLDFSKIHTKELLTLITQYNPSDEIYYVRPPKFTQYQQKQIFLLLTEGDPSFEYTFLHKVFSNSDYENFYQDPNYRFTFILDSKVKELERFFSKFSKFIDLKLSIFCGTPRSKYYHQIKENLFEDRKVRQEYLKFIISKNIAPFIIFSELPITFDKKNFKNPQYKIENGVFTENMINQFQKIPKIIIKATSKNITAAIDSSGFLFVGAYGMIWDSDFPFSAEVLCAILNSDLINLYITHKYQSYMVNSQYLSISSILINDIPLPGKIIDGRFVPVLELSQFNHISEKIQHQYSELRKIIHKISQTGSLRKIRDIKKILDNTQLNMKQQENFTENIELNKISNCIKNINKSVDGLYGISEID